MRGGESMEQSRNGCRVDGVGGVWTGVVVEMERRVIQEYLGRKVGMRLPGLWFRDAGKTIGKARTGSRGQ